MTLKIDFLNNLRWIHSVSVPVEHIVIEFGHEHKRMELLELSRCILLILKDPAEESIFIEGVEALSLSPYVKGNFYFSREVEYAINKIA